MAAVMVCACAGPAPEQTGGKPVEGYVMGNGTALKSLVVELEREALEQFGRGDVDGPIALCSDVITYFDPLVDQRIEGRQALAAYYEAARGRTQYLRFDVIEPRVQAHGDTAILTYVLATTGSPDSPSEETRWKVTAVYHKFGDDWLVVHSHFARFAGTMPRDFELAHPPSDLGQLEDALLRELLTLENAAMERWRRGDPWGFWELSAPAVSYFDPETDGRLDGADGLRQLYASVEGKIHYDVSEYIAPRVQALGDVAVLSYQYRSAEKLDDGSVSSGTRWNTTEVFARIDGRWRIIHTHWSYARAGSEELVPAR
jgi:ketosteroid isomerase-like protein